MRKQFPALLAAFLMTGIIAFFMAVVGVNALYNPNSTAVSNAPTTAASMSTSSSLMDQAQIAQYQALISQYNQREQQYQQQIQTDQQQLAQADNQIQAFQQLLVDLENRGIISIDQNGTITILARGDN